MKIHKLRETIKNEQEILIISKKSELNFLEGMISQSASFLSALFFFVRKKIDELIITDKRIILTIANKVICNVVYKDFSTIKYNSMDNRVDFIDINNNKRHIGLKSFRITFDEIQHLKKTLNAHLKT